MTTWLIALAGNGTARFSDDSGQEIHDIGAGNLALEYVEGKPPSGPLPKHEAARQAIQIATALEEAHPIGIIFRDLKPSNRMMAGKVQLSC